MALSSMVFAKSVIVEAEGTGKDFDEAKTSALIDAMRQVTGVQLDSQTMSHMVAHSSSDEKGTKIKTEESQEAVYRDKAKGVINGFRILSKKQDPATGDVEVVLSVDVEKYDLPEVNSNRRSISVQAFEAPAGVCFGKTLSPERLVDSLIDSAQASLSATRKFSVLDRHSEAYALEKQFINSEDTKQSEQAKLGLLKGSDYILNGKIQNINITETKRKLKLSNGVQTNRSARADFIFNVMLFATREIKFSSRIHIELKDGLADLTCDEISDKLAHMGAVEVARQATLAIFPPKVLNVVGDDVYFNYGGNDIKLGDVYKVYSEGKAIIDPYTKESLGNVEVLVGKAKVTDVKAKMSVATMEKEGSGDRIKPGDILRPHVESPKDNNATKPKTKRVRNDEW